MRTAEKRGGLFSGGYGTLGHTNKILVSQARLHRFFPTPHGLLGGGEIVLFFLVKVVRTNLSQSIAYYVIAKFTSRDAPCLARAHARFQYRATSMAMLLFFLVSIPLLVSTKIVSRQDLSTKLLRDWRIVNSF